MCHDPVLMARPKESWPIIRPRLNKSGKIMSWMVDGGMMDGRRVRFFYKTKDEAETKAGLMRVKRKNEGETSFGMSAYTLQDTKAALALLSPHNVTLKAAAEFYLANLDVIRSAKPVNKVVEELLEIKEQDRKSDRYLRDLKFRLNTFAADFPSRSIHEIHADEIDTWLRSLSTGPVDRNNYRRLVSVLFGFATKRRYVLKNPISDVEIANTEVSKPGILDLNEASALLEVATPDFVPVIALGLFAGLRPEAEIWRLDWSHIDLDAREIDVQKSKNLASYRFVKISDNLAAWLKPYAKKKGPLWPLQDEAFFRRMREIRERAAAKLEADGKDADNLRDWPSDCLRHSFASYLYALKGAEYTAKELGHGGKLDLLHRRYRNRVRETEALAFWQILPASAAVPFSVGAA